MEILRIKVFLTDHITVQGHTDTAVMLPFTGSCECPLFTGRILSGGVDTQRITHDGRCSLSARYSLEGVDDQGLPCKLFIENVACANPGADMVTHPSIRTDSESLRWLETTDLTGAIEHVDGHIEIPIFCADTDQVKHLALRRANLTLRGILEKKATGPCPLVIMLHGFAACMDACEGGFLQEWSDALTAAGFATLRFDFNGHGQSEGSFLHMTPMNEVEDAAAVLQYALTLPDVTEIHLLGHSQGGVIAGMLAGYYHDVVKRLVMLTPAASLKTDAQEGTCMGNTYDPQRIPASVQVSPTHTVGGLYFRMAQTLPIHEVTACFHGDALAVIGGQDTIVRPGDIRRYGEMMPNCRVLEKATLDHGLGGAEHAETLQTVVQFLQGQTI